jgi:uncharacterized membrane protein
MPLFSFLFTSKPFLTDAEEQRVTEAISAAEQKTSGEIRVYMESRCSYLDPVDRAKELFYQLNMQQTEQGNGVLLYLAIKDHQLAIYGGQGIHEKVGTEFWNKEVRQILSEFKAHHYAEGIVHAVGDIGAALQTHFPYDHQDKNELSNEIIFGK